MNKRWVLLAGAVLFLNACNQRLSLDGGGASETVASVTPRDHGIQVSVNGSAAFSVRAAVFHNNYSVIDSDHFSDSALLNNDGPNWDLPNLSDSVFFVILVDSISGNGACFRYDNEPAGRESATKKLAPCGGVAGVVTVTSSGGETKPVNGCFVVLQGSHYIAPTDESGGYRMSGIPEGNYRIEAVITQKIYIKNNEADTIAISGDRVNSYNFNVMSNN
jgi:hypothetical protein